MALVLANRVQESATANTTVSFTLTGAIAGFQSFAVIGDTNTTFYSATDGSGSWEVGLGTYSTTGPTLTRTTIYASSNSNLAVTFSGAVNVFVTYPSGRSVNLDASGNVSALGTVSSGTWQGSTVGVAYGGTGVTASSGANSVVLRDANSNITVNRVNQANTNTTAAGGTTTLTAASSYIHTLVGTGGQTYALPDATTLTTGVAFVFNNLATSTLTITDYATATIGTIPSGGAGAVFLTNNGTTGGTWDLHSYLPEGVTFGTNAFNLGSAVISGGTWQGGTIQPAYGGTGLTTFVGANNALYSTGASTLTAGTLPTAAGGTGLTSFTANRVFYASSTSAIAQSANLTFDGTTLTANALTTTSTVTINGGTANGVAYLNASKVLTTGSALTFDGTNFATTGSVTSAGASNSGNLAFTGTGNRITGDFTNGTIANRVFFQTSTSNSNSIVGVLPSGTATQSSIQVCNASNPGSANFISILATSSETSVRSSSHAPAFLPMTFYTGNSERMRIDTSGNVGIGTSSPLSQSRLTVAQDGTATAGGLSVDQTNGLSNRGGGIFLARQGDNRASIESDYFNGLIFSNKSGTGSLTEKVRIDTSGNVGIGTSSPSYRLDVQAAIAVTQTKSTTGTNAAYYVASNTGGDFYIGRENSAGTIFGTTAYSSVLWSAGAYPMAFFTNGIERARIDSSGNLLVGTTTTGSTGVSLNNTYNVGWIQSAGESIPNIFRQTSSAATVIANGYRYSATANGFASSFSSSYAKCAISCGTAAGAITFYTDTAATVAAGTDVTPTERMRITSSGNVGIGTSSPASKFSVANGSSGGFEVNPDGTASGPALIAYNRNTSAYLQMTRNALLHVWETSGTERARITADGLFQFNSGYGSVATAYGCRAWVNFNGTGTVAIRGSGNVTSITDNGTGDYTVNFTSAMPDANYSVVGVTGGWGSAYNYATVNVGAGATPTTSAVRIATRTAGTFNDEVAVCISVFR